MGKSFKDLRIPDNIIEALKLKDIEKPTEIQEQIIPLILNKKDVVAESETGSGKTFAYLIPAILNTDFELKSVQSLVLTPTHELAIQVENELKFIIDKANLNLKSAVIIGSGNISRQLEKLKQKPLIVIGSSGRILELISKKKIPAHTIKTIVIDEADRMLDNKNISSVTSIIKSTLKDRQIVLVSASIPSDIIKLSQQIMKEPIIIKLNAKRALQNNIRHIYFLTAKRDKIDMLRKIIRSENPKRAIVFVNNPNIIETVVEKLEYHKIKTTGIYGLADKLERKAAMDQFRLGKVQVLVSSDLGSRGLDISGVTHIINLDIPEDTTFYLHRAGRTGRNGIDGCSISLVTKGEERLLKKYEKQFGIEIIKKELKYGKVINAYKDV